LVAGGGEAKEDPDTRSRLCCYRSCPRVCAQATRCGYWLGGEFSGVEAIHTKVMCWGGVLIKP